MTSNEVTPHGTPHRRTAHEYTWQTLIEFDLSMKPGSERLAVDRVAQAVQRLNWPAAHLEQLKLALAQATRNNAERSHLHGLEARLVIRVLIPEDGLATWEPDRTNDAPTQLQAAEREAKQVGRPPSRGWGFFLIEKMAPDASGARRHLIELFLYPEGEGRGKC